MIKDDWERTRNYRDMARELVGSGFMKSEDGIGEGGRLKIKMAKGGGLRIIEEKRFDGIILFPWSRVYFY